MKRHLRIALFMFCIAASVILISNLIFKYKRNERAYEHVRTGTSKVEVLKLFGKPKMIGQCNTVPSWDGARLPLSTDCVEEYLYQSEISPEQWIIGFNSNGGAVTKYHFVSP